jgi:tetratricopeptide (TPR) repeat protein
MSCGQLAEAEDLFQQSLNICTERGFLASRATITIFMGLVSVLRGQPQAGLEQVRRGMAFFAASSATKLEGYHLALALASAGKPDEALAALIPRLEKMEQRGMQNDLADMHHFKGRLLEGKSNSEEAEKSFRTSIEIARRQSAKSLELRATISLTRLLAKQGRRDEARATLAEIYNWFTEGFDTADLKDAKAQLEELSDRQTTTTRR